MINYVEVHIVNKNFRSKLDKSVRSRFSIFGAFVFDNCCLKQRSPVCFERLVVVFDNILRLHSTLLLRKGNYIFMQTGKKRRTQARTFVLALTLGSVFKEALSIFHTQMTQLQVVYTQHKNALEYRRIVFNCLPIDIVLKLV